MGRVGSLAGLDRPVERGACPCPAGIGVDERRIQPRSDFTRHRGIERRLQHAAAIEPRQPLAEQLRVAVTVGVQERIAGGGLLPHPQAGPLVLEPLIETTAAAHVFSLEYLVNPGLGVLVVPGLRSGPGWCCA